MQPRISFITLGVDDLERALAFYRDGLGLPTRGIVGREYENGSVVFFEMQPGLRLALWPRRSLATDTGLAVGPSSPTEFSISHNVDSRAEVDRLLEDARAAASPRVVAARDTPWGVYAGYFQDPDGHLWEVAWNPRLQAGGEQLS